MARNPSANSARARFAELLTRHLLSGTHPTTDAGEPWTDAAFSSEILSERSDDGHVSARSVSNWRKGTSLPLEIEPILRALFGPDRSRHALPREELRAAFQAARTETVVQGRQDKAGALWVPSGDEVVIDRSARPSDQKAAEDPLRQQMQSVIQDYAAELSISAKRLDNTRIWSTLSKTAKDFLALISVSSQDIPNQLVRMYALLTRLGGFLETDVRVQRDRAAMDDPLDPDIQGALSQLVRIAAPWLRGFPTVADLDDRAGKFLVRADLVQPAREFTRRARATESISQGDAAEMELLGEAANAGAFLGEKAGNRLVGSSKNLMLTLTQTGNDNMSLLRAQRARETLLSAPDQVAALSEGWPPDLRHALISLVAEWRRRPRTDWNPTDDIESHARDMIIAGQVPPAEWWPFIRHLDLSNTLVADIAPLAGFTNLRTASFRNTPVIDIMPLAALESLVELDLRGTGVKDVTPVGERIRNSVFCFTPKQQLIQLPRGATPIDFAYAVHSQVGDTCVGAKINGRLMPLRFELQNGDQVEIMTARGGTPSPSWERFVVTGKARARIRQYEARQQRTQTIEQGRTALTLAFRHEGLDGSEKVLETAMKQLKCQTLIDLYLRVGGGHIRPKDVVHAGYPDIKPQRSIVHPKAE